MSLRRNITPIEARVLATLMEKSRTVPDSYPLSLNALVLGCNQKSSREPVMNVTEVQAQEALDALKPLSLVFESGTGRVARYAHNAQRGLGVSEPQAVLLGLLMLRGAQTVGELRIGSERWYKFADGVSIETVLNEIKSRGDDGGPALAMPLPRSPGLREQRWAHLLCGMDDLETFQASNMPSAQQTPARAAINLGANSGISTAQRLELLEAQVQTLQSQMAQLRQALGVAEE